ncbi:hypothetical protein [Paractinoplanes ferrugineus]|nr:hypothetical protein [Actinoplanes ferrugineus]
MAGPSSAFADDPNPTVSVKATAGKAVCKVTDKKLDEMSGIVATKSGFVVVNDSTTNDAHKKVFFLDTKCKVVDEVAYSGKGPFDPEDLILSPDGRTLWIADIGDNNYDKSSTRPSLALWTMPVDGSKKPVIHRVSYPDNDHHDAEALLLTGDNIPLIITKEIGRAAVIYQPTAALKADNDTGIPLKKVGELTVNATETSGNPYARIGNKTIDGGAVALGGKKVVLRTYTDALEWDVTNGDVLGTITKSKPRTTALPDETLGEAITYSPDGTLFYTVSDMNGADDAATSILKYTPATTVTELKKASGGSGGGTGTAWYADITLDQITWAVGAVGILGLILVGAGIFGITKHRKRTKSSPAWSDDDPPEKTDSDADPETELIGVGGAQQRGVYGGARSGPAAPSSGAGVYGNNNAQRSGPVYGAGGAGAAASVSAGAAPAAAPGGGRPPQGQPGRGPQGQPPRPQGQPARGPQGQPARNPQGQPARGQQGQPPRGPQGQPPRGPQGQPPRGPQGQPPRGPQGQPPQGQPARNPQSQPPRGPQGQPPRGPQGQPAQGQPARNPQGQPARGQQGQPPRGPQGQPPRNPQGQPARGQQGQPPRGPQQQPGGRSGPVYGGGGTGGSGGAGGGSQQHGQPPRGPQGQRPQRPAGPQGQGGGQGGQGPRPPQGGNPRQGQGRGVYGQPGTGQGRPPQRGGDDRGFRPEERFDNPGYRR